MVMLNQIHIYGKFVYEKSHLEARAKQRPRQRAYKRTSNVSGPTLLNQNSGSRVVISRQCNERISHSDLS